VRRLQCLFLRRLRPLERSRFLDDASMDTRSEAPRTMEILDGAVGFSGDVTGELAPALQAVSRKPGYPIAVTCT
jgi:hypothetical protein